MEGTLDEAVAAAVGVFGVDDVVLEASATAAGGAVLASLRFFIMAEGNVY